MPALVTMPKWGLTMKEGTVAEWLRAEGAAVAAGEPLLVVESDKAANDVEAPAAGTLRKIVAGTGARVPVSGPVAVIALPNETLSDEEVATFLAESARRHAAATTERAAATRVAREARPAGRSEEGRINASPAARKLARELSVDLASVQATGPGGRITTDDVERVAAGAAARGQPPGACRQRRSRRRDQSRIARPGRGCAEPRGGPPLARVVLLRPAPRARQRGRGDVSAVLQPRRARRGPRGGRRELHSRWAADRFTGQDARAAAAGAAPVGRGGPRDPGASCPRRGAGHRRRTGGGLGERRARAPARGRRPVRGYA